MVITAVSAVLPLSALPCYSLVYTTQDDLDSNGETFVRNFSLVDQCRHYVNAILGISPRASMFDAVEFRRFVRSQDREKFVEVCHGVCGRNVFPRSAGCRRVIIIVFVFTLMLLKFC